MKLFLSALAAFTFVLAQNLANAALPAGSGDLAVDIAFYNSRVDGVSANLSGQSFRSIYAATSPRTLLPATDVVYAIPHDASAPLYNATQAAGKIVLIDRGFVEFDVQAANATAAGAAGIIVVNNIGDPAVPSMQQTTKGTGVPDVMISQNDGDTIKAAANFSGSDGTAGTQTTVIISPDVQADRILKLNAADGSLQWHTLLGNDGALAVDPGDLGIYTAKGGHNFGNDGFVYKLNSGGSLAWSSLISLNSYCDFFYVTNVAVDAFSSNPGVVWSENGCFGALAKSDRSTGAQQWSLLTYDVGRPSINPTTGQIYTISDAGSQYVAETIYSVTAGGVLSYGSSCEGFTDLNPADSQLYRGGGNPGCGTTLSQLSTSNLGTANWSMDLSPYIGSFDALAVQPWQGGYIYVASVASSKIVVVDPVTQTVVTSFNTALAPKYIAVNPIGGNVYIADDSHPTVIAYSPTGALVWINPNLGGTVTNLATVRGGVGQGPATLGTVATNLATNVTDTSATLNGTVNPNGTSTTVYFQYGTTTAYGSQTANQVFTGSTSQSVTAGLTGLTQGTTYHYRIIAKNGGGTATGNDVAFTTATPTPTPAPSVTTNAATNLTDTSATLNGTVNPNGSSTTVYFQYGTSTAYGSQTANQVFTGGTSQSVTANITGLTAGTTYHYRIVAANGGGTSTGNDITFTAVPTCPAPTVRISSDRNSIHKGENAIIDLFTGSSSATLCHQVIVHYTVKTHAQQGVDYVITDATGQVVTNGQTSSSPLTLHCLYTSRTKTLLVNIVLQKDPAYYLGNTKVTVQLLAN